MSKLRVMSVMAHPDDFELVAGGTFSLIKQRYGNNVDMKILTTTHGGSGHMEMSIEQTKKCREKEARQSASMISAEYESLRQLDGSQVEMQVIIDRNFLGGLWNAIRDFEPDVIFCPPIPNNPLAGIHIDHYNTAVAMRMISYELCVPNAYPTRAGKSKIRFAPPLIINVDDNYCAMPEYHICCDISSVFEQKASMLLCHRSQIFEWLPFVEGRCVPSSEAQWKESFFLERHRRTNSWHQRDNDVPREYFRFTAWGRTANEEDIQMFFPLNCERHQDVEKLLQSPTVRNHYIKTRI